jgi:hypothetical protein
MSLSSAYGKTQPLPLAGALKLLASAMLFTSLAVAALPAHAAPAAAPQVQKVSPTKEKVSTVAVQEPTVAVQDPEVTSSVQQNAASTPNCDRSRKRLFVEGEGWIVRRVTTCY